MNIEYDKDLLLLPKITCDCDYHVIPDCNIHIGDDIINNLNEYISKKIDGEKCLLVTDNTIFNLFGKKIVDILEKKYKVTVSIPTYDKKLKPNQKSLGHVLMDMDIDTDFLIAFGSGSINDITRYIAFNTNKPFVSIGTAASMDGYLSVVAPMLKDNLKINKPATYPAVGIFDLTIMQTAPKDMLFAGFGDVIGKYIAKADWILSSYVTNEHICTYCLDLVDTAIDLCTDNIDEIAAQSKIGVKKVLEALLLTGLAMLINKDSRPAASNEHNMGHFWEMKKLQNNLSHPSHGEAVGVATLYCLDFYNEFLSYDLATLKSITISDDERSSRIKKAYGEDLGQSIIDNNTDEPISSATRDERFNNFNNNIYEIRNNLKFLKGKDDITRLYRKLDGPTNAIGIGIEHKLLKDALLYAKDYRSRYTIFKLAEETGILEDIVNKII